MRRQIMSGPFPADRVQLDAVARKPIAALYRLERSIELDVRLANLVKVRASQINGCAFCIDVHWKDARADRESEERASRALGSTTRRPTIRSRAGLERRVTAWMRLIPPSGPLII
jgi:AhpD family alkylhydroperoxidase